jgi:hypothetical protein
MTLGSPTPKVAMFKSITSKIATLRRAVSTVHGMAIGLDEMNINLGIMLAEQNKGKHSTVLKDYEFKVFSQWGEDGILQHLTDAVEIREKTFIEFGVGDFFESNCRFLMMKDNWSGFVLDGSSANIRRLKESYFYWKYELLAVDAFITKDNVNELLKRSEFGEDLGILSVDLDGNDYHVLEAVTSFRPRILICEYNAVFGPTRRITVPYDDGFVRTRKHHSNLYCGASLGAIIYLAKRKGYSFAGTNSAGNNAFFVRNDLLNQKIASLGSEDGFSPSKFRESRDDDGRLSYVAGDARLRLIAGLPVLNVETGRIEKI